MHLAGSLPGLGYWLPSGSHVARKEAEGSRRKPKDGRWETSCGLGTDGEKEKTERKTPGCRGTQMKETERMKDESVTAWDTFGKKTRMNSVGTGAYQNL